MIFDNDFSVRNDEEGVTTVALSRPAADLSRGERWRIGAGRGELRRGCVWAGGGLALQRGGHRFALTVQALLQTQTGSVLRRTRQDRLDYQAGVRGIAT